MATPEEFTIRIEPDGRIILDGKGMHETSYQRIVELLGEAVGPIHQLDVKPGDPPGRYLHPIAREEEEKRNQVGQK